VENVSTEERMFRAGQLHITGSVPPDKIEVYRKDAPQFLRVEPYLGNYFYRFNTQVPQLADPRVRRALAMSIDRQQIVDHVTKGGQVPAYAFTPPDTLGYTAAPGFAYDPQGARDLLAAAGYPDGAGFPPTELLYNTSESHRKLAVAIQQMWKRELNIEITLNNQDWKVYLDSVNNGNYQIARGGWIGDYVDPNSFLDMWVTDGGNNRTGWSDPRYDELVMRLAPAALSREQRYAWFREAEARLMDAMPVIPIFYSSRNYLMQPSVRGLPPNLLGYPLFKQVHLEPAR
jgi:oligopeptide transport system substrate-binding protein